MFQKTENVPNFVKSYTLKVNYELRAIHTLLGGDILERIEISWRTLFE